jgi:ribosomal protein S18 acetylase RimI-like enzyme
MTANPQFVEGVAPQAAVTARLRDGSLIRLRPVTPDDRSLLVDGFNRLSPRARYLRFLAPADHLTQSQLAYLSEVDHRDHVAWGALDGEAAAGVGRWVRLADPTAADVAVTILDEYQRRGIGRLLLQTLAISARARGIGVLHFDVLAENEAMKGLLESIGAVPTDEGAVVHYVADVSGISGPDIVDGDIVGLLEAAHRSASAGISPDRDPD